MLSKKSRSTKPELTAPACVSSAPAATSYREPVAVSNEIVTHNPEEYSAVVARADRLALVNGRWVIAEQRDYAIESVCIVAGHNGWWKFRVHYNQTKNPSKTHEQIKPN